MLRKVVLLSSILASPGLMAAKTVDLYHAPLSRIKKFLPDQKPKKLTRAAASVPENNSLSPVSQTQKGTVGITRYQQLYKGIPVVGAQVMVSKGINNSLMANNNEEVNGNFVEGIQINTKPAMSSVQAMNLAKKQYFSIHSPSETQGESSELQIRVTQGEQVKLVYLVSFKSIQSDKPVWPFFVIDAQTGAIITQWNNIKNYLDSGPGGNEKVGEYWYGKDDIPALNVTQAGSQCIMDTPSVRLVNLRTQWDWADMIITPFGYECNNNSEDNTNGAFSPANDAYYFGHTIVDMYKGWYGLNALQYANGFPMKLMMRVHFGQSYDNAFWDGQAMSFGDGRDSYPLVSLDIASHEVTHGFTQQHSNLEYHDQSGALNESVSDMAGQAARAYLLETSPRLYKSAYSSDEITWGVGETITRDASEKAIRFMDFPSSDGNSADCMDKDVAKSYGAHCAISYPELIAFATYIFPDEHQRQNYIVHTASGVFNKAFYLLSQNIGIKKAYHVMIIANTKYWTPSTDFKSGACGVLKSANDLGVGLNMVKTIFGQVGIDTNSCVI